jgi:hypothetical protein
LCKSHHGQARTETALPHLQEAGQEE